VNFSNAMPLASANVGAAGFAVGAGSALGAATGAAAESPLSTIAQTATTIAITVTSTDRASPIISHSRRARSCRKSSAVISIWTGGAWSSPSATW
jgi:hypothetical protein